MVQINRYRARCETEDAFVHAWSTAAPIACPNGHDHVLVPGSATVVESVDDGSVRISNLPMTPFDRVLTSEETNLIDIKSGLGVSVLRDIVIASPGSTVTNDVGKAEYIVDAAPGGGTATLRSAERGRYQAGLAGEVGIGGHIRTRLVAGQSARFGMFDDSDGFFFEVGAASFDVVVVKDGVETVRVPRHDFNIDCLDGTGPSGHVLRPDKGYIWTIRFSWFGFGVIEFSMVCEDLRLEQHVVPIHRHYPPHSASVSKPNLPISVVVRNDQPEGGARAAVSVTARKYGVLGRYDPSVRFASVHDFFVGGEGSGSSAQHLFSVRRKPAWVSAPVTLVSMEARCAGATAIVSIRLGAAARDIAWRALPGFAAGETAVEYAEGAGAADGNEGVLLWRGFAHPEFSPPADLEIAMRETDSISVFVLGLAEGARLAAGLRWSEEW
jgi:hypothetical protein